MIHLDSGKPRFWECGHGEGQFRPEPISTRRIYLSTLYDRYRPGEDVRLALSTVTDYAFGVKRAVALVAEGAGEATDAVAGELVAESDCTAIADRAAGRALHMLLPADVPPGTYRIRLDFCRIPYPQMPASVLSNPIEVMPVGTVREPMKAEAVGG